MAGGLGLEPSSQPVLETSALTLSASQNAWQRRADDGSRTRSLALTEGALDRSSYVGVVRCGGLEPPASPASGERSSIELAALGARFED